MTRAPRDHLLVLVQRFFDEYLRRVRGASKHTIRAYRDALTLFFGFLAKERRRSVADLGLDDIHADAVLTFLNHVETARGNSVVTRNCRLAAIRSFVEHLLRHDLARAEQYRRILAIRAKRAVVRPASYLEAEEARAVIAAVDARTSSGLRDRALLLFLYNAGARVSEALALRPRDLHLERPRQVRVLGKGGKERLCPIWPETAAAFRQLLDRAPRAVDEFVFQNSRGGPLTRDGAAYLLEKYAQRAATSVPHLRRRRITPHVLRHSCAVALLQSGAGLTVIRDYLGHASVETTNRYVTSNLRMKREVLEAFWKRAGLEPGVRARWRPTPKLLAYLAAL